MPETFMDRRRNHLREIIESYGGDPDKAQEYLEAWLKGRLRQADVEMMIADDHGATSEELAEQFGYSNSTHARSAVTRARHRALDGAGS